MTYKNRKKVKKFQILKYLMFSFDGSRPLFTVDVLYEGQEIRKQQSYLYLKMCICTGFNADTDPAFYLKEDPDPGN
jgi:hypothetical protein